jgi:putative endonuclease
MYYVYVLFSHKDKRVYIGYTEDLKKRYTCHILGKVASTKYLLPVMLLYYEAYLSKKDATKREYFLKRGRGHELLQKLLIHSITEAHSQGGGTESVPLKNMR